MLFSSDPVKFEAELKEILPFAASYQFERVRGLIRQTEEIHLVPLLGERLYSRICDDSDLEKEQDMCRNAMAHITVYENFTLFNTQILPGGFARLTGENTGTLYKYQEGELKGIFRRNGFDALDKIVCYFCTNVERFPEFEDSEYYQAGRGELIPDRMIFARYYKPISHIVFRFLQSFIRRAEDLDFAQFVELQELRSGTLEGTLTDKQKRTIELSRPVIVCLAVAYAVEDMGVNITDCGVWIESRQAGDGIKTKLPAEQEKAERVAGNYRKMAGRYLEELQKHLSGCGSVNPLKRDNNGKKTMWL